MLRYKRGSNEWLEFEIFQEFPEVMHAVFLRESEIMVDGEVVRADQIHGATILEAVVGMGEVVRADQIHGATILEAVVGMGEEKCDGLVTHQKDVGLLIKHADCQAAIFYDPIKKVIGNVHAGWRGQVQNIYQEMVGQLGKLYGCKPENLVVGVSPSLGPCCAQFIHYEKELPFSFLQYQIKPLYFDLWEITRDQLMKAGILREHIQIAEICTCCNPADYFSYRRDKIKGRNQATVVCLKEYTYRSLQMN